MNKYTAILIHLFSFNSKELKHYYHQYNRSKIEYILVMNQSFLIRFIPYRKPGDKIQFAL